MTPLIVDLFAGGGGASLAIETALGRSPDIAVNHDPEAVAMHAANHPATRHLCGDVWDVRPRQVCDGRPVELLWASPDCTFHSKARGGKPFRDPKSAVGRRGLAWVVTRWARDVRPRVICLENVEEFEDWGPLGEDGRPDPARRGLTFRRWVGTLKAAGYAVEWRELRACDYGAPTSRKRLFLVARSDGLPIVWPLPTHGPGRIPYRTAAECIDWSIPCPSIFGRRKPLAEKTLRRIARGIRRFVLDAADPFIIPTTHGGDDRVHSIRDPLRTITSAHRGEHAIVAPTLVKNMTNNVGQRTDAPLSTILTGNHHYLVAPTMVQTGYGEREGQAPRVLDLHKPLTTVVADGQKHALVSAFLAKHFGGHEGPGSSLSLPFGTVTCRDHHAIVTASVQGDRRGEVRAFLTKYYGTSDGQQAQLPLGTVTTRDRFGIVIVRGEAYEISDIGMRMLQPRELFRAQGFPDSYVIDPPDSPLSKTAQVRMCGNSVSPPPAVAILKANLAREEVVAA
jgi:DNA (cytosine-5)-methyltransferase 1